MLSTLVTTSLLALQAAAFLVVPEVKSHLHHGGSHSWSVQLQCDECPFPSASSGSKVLLDDARNSWLSLNFSTKGSELSVNGQTVFPPVSQPNELKAVLQRQSDKKTSAPVPIGFGLEFQLVDVPDSDSGLVLFHFTVLDLAGFPVPVSTVYLPTIKTPEGELLIVEHKTNVLPLPHKSWRQCRRNARCLKHLFLARLHAFVAAAKTRALNIAKKLSFKSKGCNHSKKPHLGMSQQHNSHSHKMHNHHKSATFAHRFCYILKNIMIPALIGLVAAIFVGIAILHITVGIVAVRTFCRLRRNRRIVDQEQGEAPERESLMPDEERDLPPQYNEADYGKIALPAEKE